MDSRTAKRIDSLYRNMKSMPVLTVLSVLVPILLLFAPLLSLAYLYLRAKLLRDVEAGRIVLDPVVDSRPPKAGESSIQEKLNYISDNNSRILMPLVIMLGAAILITVLVLSLD
jgi:hypothetical protein